MANSAENTKDIAVLKTRVNIYVSIVGFLFVVSWAAIMWLISAHIPKVIEAAVKSQVQVVADNSTFLLENSPGLLPQYVKSGKAPSVTQKVEIANAMMRNAEQQRITLSDEQFKITNDALKQLAVSEKEKTWDAILHLAAYRTFTNYIDAGTPAIPDFTSGCSASGPNAEIRRNDIYNCTQRLEGGLFEDNTFGNVTFIYDGAAPLVMRNNRFYNCKFQIANNENGQKFVDALIASPTPYISIPK